MTLYMRQKLEEYIARDAGQAAKVLDLALLPGGASKETWACRVELAGETIPVVLRLERAEPLQVSISLSAEFAVMAAAGRAGAPVPRPLWAWEEALDGPCCLMERVEGQTIPAKLQKDPAFERARRALPGQMARALAAIHATPLDEELLAILPDRGRDRPFALGELALYEQVFRRHAPDPHPALEMAFRWLKLNPPRQRPGRLVHGDYRLGNVICDQEGLAAVLDWELAHLGDPMEDLGYLAVMAWRFGNPHLPLAGLCGRQEFWRCYQEAGGEPVDPQAARWWEIFGNLKWAVITILQAGVFLNGDGDNVELASLGRKTVEVERQLVALLAEAA